MKIFITQTKDILPLQKNIILKEGIVVKAIVNIVLTNLKNNCF